MLDEFEGLPQVMMARILVVLATAISILIKHYVGGGDNPAVTETRRPSVSRRPLIPAAR